MTAVWAVWPIDASVFKKLRQGSDFNFSTVATHHFVEIEPEKVFAGPVVEIEDDRFLVDLRDSDGEHRLVWLSGQIVGRTLEKGETVIVQFHRRNGALTMEFPTYTKPSPQDYQETLERLKRQLGACA